MPQRKLDISGPSDQTDQFLVELSRLVEKANSLPELSVSIERVDTTTHDLSFETGAHNGDSQQTD